VLVVFESARRLASRLTSTFLRTSSPSLSNRKFITVGLNNGSKQQMAFARLTSTRRLLLFSKSSLATGHRDSCSALDKANPSLRQTSSVGICTRPLRNWATSIRSPERTKLETMRSAALETRTCGTMRNVPRAYTSTGWVMLERT
jgi:hypothetical protein